MPQIVQVAAIALATVGTGAATMSVLNEDIPDLEVPEGDWGATGALDGMTFEVLGKDVESGAVLDNVLRFRNGTFQSADCQNYCNFGWSTYETKEIDGVTHFTARTICPDAPHTVVWYGKVDGDDLTVDGTWTTRRWYWTNQITITATGTAIDDGSAAASG
jgi:hypothetical protein